MAKAKKVTAPKAAKKVVTKKATPKKVVKKSVKTKKTNLSEDDVIEFQKNLPENSSLKIFVSLNKKLIVETDISMKGSSSMITIGIVEAMQKNPAFKLVVSEAFSIYKDYQKELKSKKSNK
jgi:hypothetical protein